MITMLALAPAACRKEPGIVPADHPRLTANVTLRDIKFHASALGREMTYRAILQALIGAGQKLPVVYLLHGGGADFHSWSNDSDVARFAEQGFILVMPEGESSYYVNAAERANNRFEDYVVHDLIADVESRFPASNARRDRAIVGNSMGGFGAITLVLKHPDLFVFAAGLSPALDVPTRPFSPKRWSQWRAHSAIFGPWNGQHQYENDPFVLAQSADINKVPYMFFSCGQQEGLLPANRKFAALLAQRQFRHQFHVVPGGHDWNQWNARLTEVLAHLAKIRSEP